MPTETASGLTLRRIYDVPQKRLFEAWTSPAALQKFLGPADTTVPEVDVDLRVGGWYRIVMLRSDGEQLVVTGVYREVVPPERIVCTWSWEEDDPALAKETLLTLEFHALGDRSELVLTHEAFRDATQRSNHERGWTAVLDQLGEALTQPRFAIGGIDLSGYMVKDAGRAIVFYRDVLGLEPTRIYPENRGAEYDLSDGTTFGLWGGGGKVMPFQPSNGVLFAVDDFDAAVASIQARGIAIEMQLDLPNCRMAAVKDSEGNVVFLHKRR